LASGFLAGGMLMVAPAVTATEGASAAGWWWVAQGVAPVAVPPPPTVPDDGLYVAGDPSGPQAMAAVRFDVPAGSATVLTLRVAGATGTPVVGACPTTSAWAPIQAGPWTDRPAFDCAAGAAVGTVSGDGTTITFDVAGLGRSKVLDLAILPGTDEAGRGALFSLALERPGPDALSVAAAPPPPASSSAGGGVSPAVEVAAPPRPAFVPSEAATEAAEDVSRTDEPEHDSQPAAAGVDRAGAGLVDEASDSSLLRLLAGVVGVALLAVWVRVPRRHPAMSQRGVGRFRREREGVAPLL
jgi:hypothetical protein